MTKYIWQYKNWTDFSWDAQKIQNALIEAKKSQGLIKGQAKLLGLDEQADILIEEAFTTSAIEGEQLDRASIRSSVARRLGLSTAGLPPIKRDIDGVVDMLMDATENYNEPLS